MEFFKQLRNGRAAIHDPLAKKRAAAEAKKCKGCQRVTGERRKHPLAGGGVCHECYAALEMKARGKTCPQCNRQFLCDQTRKTTVGKIRMCKACADAYDKKMLAQMDTIKVSWWNSTQQIERLKQRVRKIESEFQVEELQASSSGRGWFGVLLGGGSNGGQQQQEKPAAGESENVHEITHEITHDPSWEVVGDNDNDVELSVRNVSRL